MNYRGLAVIGLMVCSFNAYADAGLDLAQRSVCMACHQVDAKRVGPSFRDIASRYAANDKAAEYLSRSIREGSRGLWGAIPMPAQRHVDPATALLLGEWIMSLAPRDLPGNGEVTSPDLAAPSGTHPGTADAGASNRTGEGS